MRTLAIALGTALLLTSGLAIANNCPNEMKAVDKALEGKPMLSAERMAEVKKLRAEGEAQHKAGRHDESMATLGRAKAMLGIR